MAEEKQKQVTALASLDDLATATVTVDIELPEDKVLQVTLRTPTLKEWNVLVRAVPDPVPPIAGVDANKRPILDYNNPDYLRQRAEAAEERGFRQLAAILVVPGTTEEQRLTWLREKVDANICRQLFAVMRQLVGDGEARIAARSATFHSD